MSENQTDDNEMIEIDGDHPWIQAALAMQPLPQPSSAKFEPVDLPHPTEEGKTRRAAMLTVVTGAGVMTAFLSPTSMAHMMEQAAAIFDYWNEDQSPQHSGLIVADKGMEQQAKAMHEAAQQMKRKP